MTSHPLSAAPILLANLNDSLLKQMRSHRCDPELLFHFPCRQARNWLMAMSEKARLQNKDELTVAYKTDADDVAELDRLVQDIPSIVVNNQNDLTMQSVCDKYIKGINVYNKAHTWDNIPGINGFIYSEWFSC